MVFNQYKYDIKLEWGLQGITQLSAFSDVLIIVDILSFSTCVDIATSNGARIYPYPWKDSTVMDYASSLNALFADSDRKNVASYTLSPSSLVTIQANTKLVLPSPNGSRLSLIPYEIPILCGCLRNAKAVAEYAMTLGKRISIIPAGEQWDDHTLRVALEDLIGAGAIISHLKGRLSPESKAGLACFNTAKWDILQEIKSTNSGQELMERGFENDIILACELNQSENIPILMDKYYIGKKAL